jgi:hypothetical protein
MINGEVVNGEVFFIRFMKEYKRRKSLRASFDLAVK